MCLEKLFIMYEEYNKRGYGWELEEWFTTNTNLF